MFTLLGNSLGTGCRAPYGVSKLFRQRAVLWVLGALGLVSYLSFFLDTLWRVGDEGSIVYGAQRVVEGAVPYRDFFEVMGPGAFYWLALWFQILGTSWLTSRFVVLLTAVGSAWAIHFVAARQQRGLVALLPAIIYSVVTVPIWPAANHHFDSNLWALLAFAAIVASRGESRRLVALAGVLAAFSATIMPQKGVLTLFALVVGTLVEVVPRQGWRVALGVVVAMVVAFASVGAIVIVYFWYEGALPAFLYANVIWPATRYHSVNIVPYAYGLSDFARPDATATLRATLPLPLALAGTLITATPLLFVAALPFVAVGLGLHFLNGRRQRSPTSRRTLPISYWLMAFAMFASECHRSDMMHLSYGSPVLLVVVTVILARSTKRGAVLFRRALTLSVTVWALVSAVPAVRATAYQETRRGMVRLAEEDAALTFLQENVAAGQSVFVYPYYPMYYFLADVRNPTRYSILMYHINSPEQFDEVIRSLESAKVQFVLWDTLIAGSNLSLWFPAYVDPPADQQLLEQYLLSNYQTISVKNGFRILQRRAMH